MYKKKCVYCGGVFETYHSKSVFCSTGCANKAKTLPRTDDGVCVYNEGVLCRYIRCEKCGWNPEVAEYRKRKLLGLDVDDGREIQDPATEYMMKEKSTPAICEYCGKEFDKRGYDRMIYCCDDCRNRANDDKKRQCKRKDDPDYLCPYHE